MSIREYLIPGIVPRHVLTQNVTCSDEILIAGGSATPSDSGASQPAFQHNPTASLLRGQASRPAFRTQLDLRSYPLPKRLTPVDYPFDK